VKVQNLNLSFTAVGIQLLQTCNTTISNNIITNNRIGLELLNSSYNDVLGNNITGNIAFWRDGYFDGYGIHICGSYNNIISNVIANNYHGVFIGSCSYRIGACYNDVYGNDITNNLANGVALMWDASYNNVFGNNITANFNNVVFSGDYNNVYENYIADGYHGLLVRSSNNTIIANTVLNNTYYGIELYGSNNHIYHNNFLNNTQQVFIGVPNYLNFWDNGYPSGGNYWSDYIGTDFYSGPYQNETGSDGIGDTPYVIDENSVDHYPLMGSWTPEGGNITVVPSLDVAMTFENVTSSGITTVSETDVGPEPPSGFKLAGKYYDIKTTADYTGIIGLKIVYDDSNMTEEEETSLQLMQWDETLQQWIDITTYLDAENNVIYGEASHLSIFVIVTPLLAPPLSASISPPSASLLIGQQITFTSTVSGGQSPYSYQWYLNDSAVSGSVNTTWTFTPLTTGTYKVYLMVTDSLGNTAKSNEATVVVAPPLSVSISPMSASILVGQSVTFTSTVSGGYTPYSYQWYLNGNPVSGATSETWTFTPTASGIYYVHLKVTDDKGNTAQSETARITVSAVPVGGYSYPVNKYTLLTPIATHIALTAILTTIFTTIKRKAKRKH